MAKVDAFPRFTVGVAAMALWCRRMATATIKPTLDEQVILIQVILMEGIYRPNLKLLA